MISSGNVLMLSADLGLSAWGILHHGISIRTPLSFGQASQLIGLLIIAICYIFGITPGIGTIFNMYFVGIFTDLLKDMHIFKTPDLVFIKFVYLIISIILMDIGILLYIRENIGAGPKDGFMLLLTKRFSLDVGLARTFMELTAFSIGYILGGKFGPGTIIAALSLGPILKILLKTFNYDPQEAEHEDLVLTFKRATYNK